MEKNHSKSNSCIYNQNHSIVCMACARVCVCVYEIIANNISKKLNDQIDWNIFDRNSYWAWMYSMDEKKKFKLKPTRYTQSTSSYTVRRSNCLYEWVSRWVWIECAEWQIGQSLRVVDCLFIYLSKHCPEASAREHCDNKNRQQQQQQQQNAKTFAKANEQIRRELKPIPNIIFIAHNLISLSIKRNCTMAKLTGRHSLLPLCLSVDVAPSLALFVVSPSSYCLIFFCTLFSRTVEKKLHKHSLYLIECRARAFHWRKVFGAVYIGFDLVWLYTARKRVSQKKKRQRKKKPKAKQTNNETTEPAMQPLRRVKRNKWEIRNKINE